MDLLSEAFEAIDFDESGAISFEEFKKCRRSFKVVGTLFEIF